jgi:uncharacterized protein (TIGR01777 family)
LEAVVHLAGETIAQRWTRAAKERIRESRVQGTRLLAETLAVAPKPPNVMVSASAIGFYGDRGEESLAESSSVGRGFLAGLAKDWEAATQPLESAGTRVVHLRLGIVLASSGGALRKMLPIFRLCLGGRLGSGKQHWSWIALDDVLAATEFCLTHDSMAGPVNAVAPFPVTNREFTRALSRRLNRPALMPVPSLAIKLFLGQMGKEALLAGAKAAPEQLLSAGFEFRFKRIDDALQAVLTPPRAGG